MDKTNPTTEAVKREMYRVSQDDCMIYNPTDEDFIIQWEEFKFPVPNQNKDIGWGKGKREVKRYLARWYCTHMKDQLINDLGEKKANEIIAQRRKEGKEEFTDKYVENRQVWDKIPKTDDPTLIENYMPQLFLGVVREFGGEVPDEILATLDTRTNEERVMEELQKKKYVAEPENVTEEEVTVEEVPIKK